jgi:hypothetical protein
MGEWLEVLWQARPTFRRAVGFLFDGARILTNDNGSGNGLRVADRRAQKISPGRASGCGQGLPGAFFLPVKVTPRKSPARRKARGFIKNPAMRGWGMCLTSPQRQRAR